MKTTFGPKAENMLEFREAGSCSKVNLTSTIIALLVVHVGLVFMTTYLFG